MNGGKSDIAGVEYVVLHLRCAGVLLYFLMHEDICMRYVSSMYVGCGDCLTTDCRMQTCCVLCCFFPFFRLRNIEMLYSAHQGYWRGKGCMFCDCLEI